MPVGDGASLLARRPDVRQAERRVAARDGAHRCRHRGSVSAHFAARQLWRHRHAAQPGVQQRGADLGHRSEHQLELSRTSPPVRARIHQARAGEQAAVAGFDGVVLQALKETDQSLATYGAELARRQDLLEARDRARQAFDMAHEQFLAGATSNLDLLNAEVTLVSAEAARGGLGRGRGAGSDRCVQGAGRGLAAVKGAACQGQSCVASGKFALYNPAPLKLER